MAVSWYQIEKGKRQPARKIRLVVEAASSLRGSGHLDPRGEPAEAPT